MSIFLHYTSEGIQEINFRNTRQKQQVVIREYSNWNFLSNIVPSQQANPYPYQPSRTKNIQTIIESVASYFKKFKSYCFIYIYVSVTFLQSGQQTEESPKEQNTE